jgi:hypothetical protein
MEGESMMKKCAWIFLLIALINLKTEGQAMDKKWFQTWDRPEYLEWATEIPQGYLLHIIRKESDRFLVVQAKLIMGETGLPGFEVVYQCHCTNMEEAMRQLKVWEEGHITCLH